MFANYSMKIFYKALYEYFHTQRNYLKYINLNTKLPKHNTKRRIEKRKKKRKFDFNTTVLVRFYLSPFAFLETHSFTSEKKKAEFF